MSKQQFIHLAHYNQWANKLLYQACMETSKGVLTKDVGAFFGSIFKTLNHTLLAEEIWLGRFTHRPFDAPSLDMILAEDFDHLVALRMNMDSRIIALTNNLRESDFSKAFSYQDMAGNPHILPFDMCLTHMFNHATHHRGQVHHILSSLDYDPPQLDLIYYMLEGEDD